MLKISDMNASSNKREKKGNKVYFNFIEYENVIIIKLNIELATKPKAVNFKNFMLKIIAKQKNLVIDFTSIIFIDTTFLGALIISLRKAKIKGIKIDLVMPNLDVPVWNLQIIEKISSFAKIYNKMESIDFKENIKPGFKQQKLNVI